MKRRRTFDVGGALEGDDPSEEPNAIVPLPAAKQHPLSLPPDIAAALGEDYTKAQEHHARADAKKTVSGYASDWKKFSGYCRKKGIPPLPAHPELIASYLSWLAGEDYKFATLQRARASISDAHRKAGIPSPCGDDRVKRVMKGIAKEIGTRQRRARPLMPTHLRRIFAWLDSRGKPVRALRDKALLIVGWVGALRRESLVALRQKDVRIQGSHIKVFVERDKTDQLAKGALVDFGWTDEVDLDEGMGLEGVNPLEVISAWQALLPPGEDDAPFIRGVTKEKLTESAVSDKKVERLVCAGIRAIGLDSAKYSGHSLRAGVATWLIHPVEANVFSVQKHLRHKSIGMLGVYVRDWDDLPTAKKESS